MKNLFQIGLLWLAGTGYGLNTFAQEFGPFNLQDEIRSAGTTHMISRRPVLRDWPKSTWWTQAHNIDGLLHYDPSTYRTLNETFFWLSWRPIHNYTNNIYDDEGWWALTWLHAYTASGNTQPKFLHRAERLFHHIWKKGWVIGCGESLYFKKPKLYQNAVTNGVNLNLSLRLYDVTHNEKYKENAAKVLKWFDASGLLENEQHLVNDGLDPNCVPQGDLWTYNQGLYIEAFSRLGQIDRAWNLFEASKKYFTHENGVLYEVNCEMKADACGEDGVAFKGIYVKSLRVLGEKLKASGDQVRFEKLLAFSKTQAEAVLHSEKNSKGWYPLRWGSQAKDAGQFTPVTHVAALEALLLYDYLMQLSR